MKLGIGGSIGPVRAGVSTRGFGMGLGPLSAGGSYKRRGRGSGSTGLFGGMIWLALMMVVVGAVVAAFLAWAAVLVIAYLVPASREWSRTQLRRSLGMRAIPAASPHTGDLPVNGPRLPVDARAITDITGSAPTIAGEPGGFCAALAGSSGMFSRKIEPPDELLGPSAASWFAAAAGRFELVRRSAATWRANTSGAVNTTYQYKTNAGASRLLGRERIGVEFSKPRGLNFADCIPTLRTAGETLYFLPAGVLRQRGRAYDLSAYGTVGLADCVVRFIETDPVPADGRQVDVTWEYVNVKGGPDRRYKQNRQLPVMAYGQLVLTSPTGLEWHVQTSNAEAVKPFADFIRTSAGIRA